MALAPSYRSPLTSATRYSEMVSTALGVLNEEKGTSFERISNYIMTRFKIVPSTNHFTQVSRNLETMIKNGTIVLRNGLYKFTPIRTLADARSPLGLFNTNMLRMPNVNLVEPNNSAKFQFAGGNVSNDVHFHMNSNVHVHGSSTTSGAPVTVPRIDEGTSKKGRGRPRKVAAVKAEPAVIVLDDEDGAAQNNVSPVAKKARRGGVKEEYVRKAKEPPRPTCKEVYDVISNIGGITDNDVMRAVKRFVNGKVDEFDMLKSLPNNQKKRSWILLLINE